MGGGFQADSLHSVSAMLAKGKNTVDGSDYLSTLQEC